MTTEAQYAEMWSQDAMAVILTAAPRQPLLVTFSEPVRAPARPAWRDRLRLPAGARLVLSKRPLSQLMRRRPVCAQDFRHRLQPRPRQGRPDYWAFSGLNLPGSMKLWALLDPNSNFWNTIASSVSCRVTRLRPFGSTRRRGMPGSDRGCVGGHQWRARWRAVAPLAQQAG